MITDIYSHRQFVIKDGGTLSSEHPQGSGIAQGCPFSPNLFIIVMSVLFHDVEKYVPKQFANCRDIAYADDTALVSECSDDLQVVLNSLLLHAKALGLEPNWKKTVHLQIKHSDMVVNPDGQEVKPVVQAVYLGGLVSNTGSTAAALTRRLGEARGVFERLASVWKHASFTKERKLIIFQACVVSKLLYGLEPLCFKKADRARINAFQARCLRQI